MATRGGQGRRGPFVTSMRLERDDSREGRYPFDLPAVRDMGNIRFGSVTVLVGDNGTGKSTLVEALAVQAGFNPEGGSRNLRFATHDTHSDLHKNVTVVWAVKPTWGWFLRAESFYGMASHIAEDQGPAGVGSLFPNLHERSHGESFLDLVKSRFDGPGLYVLDEPESALSFVGQLQLLRIIHDGVAAGAQFVIATHSPMLMAFPEASIYELTDRGITSCAYDTLELVQLWRGFLAEPDSFLRHLLSDD